MTMRNTIGASVAALAFTAGLTAQQVPVPTQALSSAAEVETFAKALDACTAAKAYTPHPLMKGFVVEHTVRGDDKGRCDYRQTMPGKMNLICGLSAEGRKLAAADLRALVNSQSIKGSTSGTGPTWMKECEIEMPDGKRIPAAGKGIASSVLGPAS